MNVPLLLLLLVSLISPISGAQSKSPYPLHKNDRWTYVTQTGIEKTTRVEGFTKLRVGKGTTQAAVLRRTDGTDRLIIRTEKQWIECGPIDVDRVAVNCDRPLIVFEWPLKEGQVWSGANLDFLVEGTERVEVPAGIFDRAWKIAYSPSGGMDPLGQIWMAEGTGPVRILEGDTDYRLVRFEPGEGPELSVAPDEVSAGILENVPKMGTLKLHRWLRVGTGYLFGEGFVWLLFFVFLAALSGIAVGLVLALRKRKSEETVPPTISKPEEAGVVSAMIRGGRLEQAGLDLEELINKNPGYPDLHFQLAQVWKANNDPAKARSSLEKALSLNENYVEARIDLGRVLMSMGKHAEASKELAAAAMRHPGYADIQLEWGRSLMALGDIPGARTTFERALEINPNFEEARRLLAECRETAQKTS